MNEGSSEVQETVARADVRVVSGRLSAAELAAIAVTVSAMSVTSRLEARERSLREGSRPGGDGWSDPVHRLPRSHALRALPSESAWVFSDR